MRWISILSVLLLCCRTSAEPSSDPPAVKEASTPPASDEPWNPAQIDWKPFDEGLALAKTQHKRICLVLFTTWCPHCKNYSHVFADPRLVERSKDFVMIRLDADLNDEVAKRYQPDGGYVPRTFILDSNGNIDPSAISDNPRFKHFFDESRADSLLRAMASR